MIVCLNFVKMYVMGQNVVCLGRGIEGFWGPVSLSLHLYYFLPHVVQHHPVWNYEFLCFSKLAFLSLCDDLICS